MVQVVIGDGDGGLGRRWRGDRRPRVLRFSHGDGRRRVAGRSFLPLGKCGLSDPRRGRDNC